VSSKKSNYLSAFRVGFVVMGIALANSAVLVAGELTLSADGIPTVKVDYSGIDLSTDKGATLLYHQLSHAAAQVCSGWEGRQLSLLSQRQRCYDKALSDAVIQVNKPLVAELHQRQSSRLSPTLVAFRAVKPRG
jgi:UrcA family protein